MPRIILIALVLSLTLSIVGCGSKRRSPYDPYTVRGKTYYPLRSAEGYSEVGKAAWYGPGFHGKSTASGERYNQNAMTCAHRTLPFGTKVRVTNLKNDRSVVVRVNDRGPFNSKYLIDLSKAAGKELDLIGHGKAKVLVEALPGQKPRKPKK